MYPQDSEAVTPFIMEPTRDELRTWLRQALAKTGETPTGLARRAGIAQSTLTRFLNSAGAPMIGLRSVAKIAHVAGMQPVGFRTATAATGGFCEPDAEPFRGTAGQPFANAVIAIIGGRNAVDPWVLRTHSLEAAGYLPGDVIIVNLNGQPRPGDIVCAQAYRWQEGRAETIFRIYEPPYLIAAARDPQDPQHRKPLLVDNDRIIIKGVVEGMLRPKQ